MKPHSLDAPLERGNRIKLAIALAITKLQARLTV